MKQRETISTLYSSSFTTARNSPSSPAVFWQLEAARNLLLKQSRGVIFPARLAHLLDRPRASATDRILPTISVRKRQVVALHVEGFCLLRCSSEEILYRPAEGLVGVRLGSVDSHRPVDEEHVALCLDGPERVDGPASLGHDGRQWLIGYRDLESGKTDERLDGLVG